MGLLNSIEKYCHENNVENEAISSFFKSGFPTTKNEEWKYTSLKKVVSEDYQINKEEAEITDEEIETLFGIIDIDKNNNINKKEMALFLKALTCFR